MADAVIAYLRACPQALRPPTPASLAVAREKLAQSLAAYRAGDRRGAEQLALSAYLDGFEPLEPVLTARDATLMARIEGAMGEFRTAIGRGEPADVLASKSAVLEGLFTDAETVLSPDAAIDASTTIGSLTSILPRGPDRRLVARP